MKKKLIICSLLTVFSLSAIVAAKAQYRPTSGTVTMWCDQSNDNPCEITYTITGPETTTTVNGVSTGVLRCTF